MRISLAQIEHFLAAAREGTFTAAARSCGVRQPSLSLSLKELEGAIGGALFSRAHGGVRLTPLGRAVRPHFAAIARAAVKATLTAQAFCRRRDKMTASEVGSLVKGGESAGLVG